MLGSSVPGLYIDQSHTMWYWQKKSCSKERDIIKTGNVLKTSAMTHCGWGVTPLLYSFGYSAHWREGNPSPKELPLEVPCSGHLGMGVKVDDEGGRKRI